MGLSPRPRRRTRIAGLYRRPRPRRAVPLPNPAEPPTWRVWKARTGRRWWRYPLAIEWALEWFVYRLRSLALFELLELAGKFTIIVAIIFWFLEADNRAKERHYRAWELINSARGSAGDGGRRDALEDLNRDGVSLAAAPLEKAYLPRVNLHNANLTGINLEGATLIGANLEGSFVNVEMVNYWVTIDALGQTFQRSRPISQKANFSNAILSDSNLKRAYLVGSNFRASVLTGSNLQQANLQEANLEQALLQTANLKGINLHNANLYNAFLVEANLQTANLQQANLQGADLLEANLQGANLAGANLQNAKLGYADLRASELRGTHLERAYFWEANLEGANLRGAYLDDATIDVKNLTQEQVNSAKGNAKTVLPAGLTRPAHWPKAEASESQPTAQPDDGGRAPAEEGTPGSGK